MTLTNRDTGSLFWQQLLVKGIYNVAVVGGSDHRPVFGSPNVLECSPSWFQHRIRCGRVSNSLSLLAHQRNFAFPPKNLKHQMCFLKNPILRWVYACKVSQAAFTRLCPDMKQCAGLNILYEMQYLLIFDVFPNFLQIPSKNKVFSLIPDLTAFLLSLVSVSENEDSGFHCIEQLFDGLHDGLHWKTKVTPQSLGLVSVLIHFGLGHDLVLVNVVLTTTLMPIKLSKLIW